MFSSFPCPMAPTGLLYLATCEPPALPGVVACAGAWGLNAASFSLAKAVDGYVKPQIKQVVPE